MPTDMAIIIITADLLRALDACEEQVTRFAAVWPDGLHRPTTDEEAAEISRLAAAAQLNIDWAAERLLPLPARGAYYEATAPAEAAYYEAVATARAAFRAARAAAASAYDEAIAAGALAALTAYDAALAPAWAAYDEAIEGARRARCVAAFLNAWMAE